MMTTAAALLGGVPLMLGAGTGAEIRQPLGYAMVGGLLISQALTLFTRPVIYVYCRNIWERSWRRRVRLPRPNTRKPRNENDGQRPRRAGADEVAEGTRPSTRRAG